jgi:hypothetical protein
MSRHRAEVVAELQDATALRYYGEDREAADGEM